MIRTQIQLEPRQEREIKRIARRDGISMAAAIRRCVEDAIASDAGGDPAALYRRAAGLVGAYRSPDRATDLAENHDDYLEEAFE